MLTKKIKNGMLGGLAGGVVFGVMMGMMGTLPMIGGMVGRPDALTGFLIHMMISAGIGAGYGIVAGETTELGAGLLRGGGYGILWWFLGPLTMMPLMMGMGLAANWNPGAMQAMLPSLLGHVMFGVILGAVVVVLRRRADAGAETAPNLETVRGRV